MTAALLSAEAGRLSGEPDVALIDLREAPEFARGHPARALCVPHSARSLALRVRVADHDASAAVLVTDDETLAEDAGRQLSEAGWRVHGYTTPDRDAWCAAGSWDTLPERPVAGLSGEGDVIVVDVREPIEWDTGYVPGAILVSLGQLVDELDRIPRDRDLVVICEAGVRSATGASILLKEGFTMVSHAPLGTSGVRQLGGPLAFPEPATMKAS